MRGTWLAAVLCVTAAAGAQDGNWFAWAPLPGAADGTAVDVVGSSGGALVGRTAAGTWHVLRPGGGAWAPKAATGPMPTGPVQVAPTARGLVTVAAEGEATLLVLAVPEGRVTAIGLPPIDAAPPSALAGAGTTVYAASDAGVWRLALDKAHAWEPLAPFPQGAPAVLAVQDGALYGMGAAGLYRLSAAGWEPLAAPPFSGVPVRSTALGQAHIMAAAEDGQLWAYHVFTDTWTSAGAGPGGALETLHAVGTQLAAVSGGTLFLGTHTPQSMRFVWIDYGVMTLYFAALVAMGVYFSRRGRGTEQFFLGGRRIPWWAVGISIFGTSLSAITYLSIPAKAYATDWVFILTNLGTVLIAPIVVAYYIPKFRQAPITTAYEYLEARFNLAARIYGSLVFLLFQLGRVSIVLFLPALALSAATGLDKYACILVMGVLATLYTVLGGIEAVIWTDVLQTVVLMAGAVLALVVIGANVDGGFGAAMATAQAADKFHTFNWTWDMTTTAVWVCVVANAFAYLYPSTADQTVVQRYLATATAAQAKRAVWTNAVLSIPTAFLFFGLGTALWVFYRQHPELLDPTLQTDAILPLFIVERFPPGLSGLIIAGVFAASMSSLDSSLNSMATVIVTDYYKRFRPSAADARALGLARVLTCVFGAIGTGVALWMAAADIVSLWDAFNKLLGLTGGGLAGLMALGVFTRRTTGMGGIIGAITGALALWAVQSWTAVHFLAYGMVGFVTCFAVGYGASWLLGRPAPARP